LVSGLVKVSVTNEVFVDPPLFSPQVVHFFYQESSLRISSNESFIFRPCMSGDSELSRLFICAWVRVNQQSNLSQLFVTGNSTTKVPVTPNPVAQFSSRHVLESNKWYSVGWRLERGVASFSSTFYISDEQASFGDSISGEYVCERLGFSPSGASDLTMDIDEVSVFSGSSVSSCISGGIRRHTIDPSASAAPSNLLGVYHFDGSNVSLAGKELDSSGAEAASLQTANFISLPSGDLKGFRPIFSTGPWYPAIIRSVNPSSSPPQGGDRITLFGLNFAESSFARCVFGEKTVTPVPGSFTEGSVVCIAPAQSPAILRLRFSNN